MRKQELIVKYRFKILVYVIITLIVFFVMYFSGKINYGDMISIVNSNEYYMNVVQREIMENNDYIQTFEYSGKSLYSFTLKYIVGADIPDAEWEVQLIDSASDTVVQSWIENVAQLNDQNLKEYVLDSPYEGTGDLFEISVKSSVEGTTGVFLFGSDTNSLLVGELLVNGQVQDGDLSVMYSEVKNVQVTLVYGLLMAMVVSGVICVLVFGKIGPKIKSFIKRICLVVWKNKFKIVQVFVLFVLSIFLAGYVEKFWMQYKELSYNWIRHMYWSVVGCILIILFYQRKYFKNKPEIVICTVLAFVGFLYIFGVQGEAEIAWDESIHYWRAVALSHANTGMANYAESYLYWHSGIPYSLPNILSNLDAAYNNIQAIYGNMATTAANTDVLSAIYIIAYLPAAVFLKVGRVLQLPYWIVFKLGLLANFSLYLTLIYLSMRKVKSGKMIVAVSATVGTAFFLATVYSYDWWIIGWFLLAMSYFFSCMQRSEKIRQSELVVMVVSSLIAFYPKAVYFPLLCIFLFLPKDKFKDDRQYQTYFAAIISSIGLLAIGTAFGSLWITPLWILLFGVIYSIIKVLSRIQKKYIIILLIIIFAGVLMCGFAAVKYILPALLGAGDIRGGTDVNSAQQIMFILENPIQYVKILINYLKDYYLVFDVSWKGIFNMLGYLGTTKCHIVSLILLVVVSITDKSAYDQWKRYNYVKWSYIILCFITICLICTALYISYTAVGLDTIIGVQQRYLLPMLYAFCALIGSCKIDNKMNKTMYNFIITVLCTSILLYNIWDVAISKFI